MEEMNQEGKGDTFGDVWEDSGGWSGNSKTSTPKRRKNMRVSASVESNLVWVKGS